MAIPVTVALVGPSRPVGSVGYVEEELAIPWAERQKVTLDVNPEETIGEVLGRAGEAFGLTVAWDEPLAESFAWVALFRPEHEEGAPIRQTATVTLADNEGRA